MEKRLSIPDRIFYRTIEIVRDRYEVIRWRKHAEMLRSVGSNCTMEIPYTMHGHEYISIGDNLHCCRGCRIQAWSSYRGYRYDPSIEIGNNVSINMNVDISCIEHISIGDNVQMASNILVVDHFHGRIDKENMMIAPQDRELFSKDEVVIEDNVWIGSNAIILPGAHIGKGCIVGAGAIISNRIPDYCVVIRSNQILYNFGRIGDC